MGKFAFPIPGRRKQTTPSLSEQPPQSKTQKFFGTTTPLNLDQQSNWGDDVTSDGASGLAVNDAPSLSSSSPHHAQGGVQAKGSPQGWDDDSSILPRSYRDYDAYTEDRSQAANTIRQQPSSSTIRSWYDRSQQPLSISQQTSSSAIARGLPSKAARMLDVSNSLAPVDKSKKKKPARLDLSFNNNSQRRHWDGTVLGHDKMTASPSVLSISSSASPHSSRRLQKRPTQESLRSQATPPSYNSPVRPGTSSSGRKYANHPNGVPDLYGHYEQMSLRQLMDLETEQLEAEAAHPAYQQQQETKPSIPTPSITRTSPTRTQPQVLYGHQHSSSHSTKSSRPSGRSHSPPASVSSKHTRTSKASRRTDNSFHDTDIVGKSVLSLSSDSEDDDGYEERSSPTSPPMPDRTPSYYEGYAAKLNQWQPAPANELNDGLANESRPPSAKRTSFAPYHTYLPVPGQTKTASSASSPSPEGGSTVSDTSDADYQTWQTRSPAEMPDNGPCIMGLSEDEFPADNTNEGEDESSPQLPEAHRSSVPGPTDQPTPPLSPSSVNFYIRSAHSSIDGSAGVGGDNRFIAVSRQEELLLAALRQRKKQMRQSFIAEEVSARLEGRPSRKASSATHKSKSSTSTAGDGMFDFDFPTPPSSSEVARPQPAAANSTSTSAPQLPPFSPLEAGMSLDAAVLQSPPPKAKSKKAKKGILKISVDRTSVPAQRDSTQSGDWPMSPQTAQDAEELKLFLQDMDDSEHRFHPPAASQEHQILQPRAFSGFKPPGRRKSSHALPLNGHRSRPSVVPEAEEEPHSPTLGFEMGSQTLRTVASVSADDFPTVPSSHHHKSTARLSAVGNHGWFESEAHF